VEETIDKASAIRGEEIEGAIANRRADFMRLTLLCCVLGRGAVFSRRDRAATIGKTIRGSRSCFERRTGCNYFGDNMERASFLSRYPAQRKKSKAYGCNAAELPAGIARSRYSVDGAS
jgi:hypothetical protein